MRSARGAIRWTPRSRRAAHRANPLKAEAETLREMAEDTQAKIQAAENAAQGYALRLENKRKKAEAAKAEADKLLLDANEQARRAKLLEDLERNLEASRRASKPSCASGSAAICGAYTAR